MFRPVRGMKDLYGADLAKYNYIIQKAIKVSTKYGYKQINTPVVEYTEVFQRSIGSETDVVSKEMYTFIDKGGESITLRPEGTAGVIRAIVSENLTQKLPLKLMYYGEMFRYDRPQKGRYRQFRQLGFEHIGDKGPYVDALTIAMASEILNSIGSFDFKILVNTLGDEETRENYTKAIVKFFSRHENELSEESKARLKKNPLRILDSKDSGDKEICSMAPMITDYLSKESGKYFEEVCRLLNNFGLNYEIDSFLVRGLDYYSHVAFELKSTANNYKDSLGGGGRYDKLLNMFGGPDVSGVGFAFGIERLILTLENANFFGEPKKTAVIPVSDEENDDALNLLKLLHNCDINAEFICSGNLNKKMKIANKLDCELALIIGENERKDGTIMVKFMNSSADNPKSKSVNYNQIVQFVKNNLHS
jgi:histidyl-tRNA synthetase